MKLSTACLLLGLCHLGSAAALGLGDVSVRSHLGQPLHATVGILGATPELTADCFHVGNDGSLSPLQQPQLSLTRTGDQVTLHIRTPQAINDPIAQFVLVADCESRLQRDYVVLLDPPPLVAVAVADPAARSAAPASDRAGDAAQEPATRTHRAPARKTTPRAQPASSPHLVLSGRHRTAPEQARAFALRFDTNLPDPTRAPEEPLTATELSDENTALTHKLAHLETQLAALQQRNAELEALQRTPAPASAPPPVPETPQWPLYLLALVALVASLGLLVLWMRRRGQAAADTVLPDVLAWTPPPEPAADSGVDGMPASDAPHALHAVHAHPERIAEIPPPPTQAEGTEIKEDILDQAEVFMAHGHGDLAIHLLQEHLREAPTESPVPWLLLLDLLHRAGDTAGYATASAECRRYFNVNLSGHPISQDGNEPGPGLEAYPHLLEKLVHVWNTAEVTAFFEDLIYDKRGGTRVGFEPSAYRDILLLRDISQQTLPLAA